MGGRVVPVRRSLKQRSSVMSCRLAARFSVIARLSAVGRRGAVRFALPLALAMLCRPALAQYSDGAIRVGVLTDLTGQFADASGQGSVVAAQLAADDFRGRI